MGQIQMFEHHDTNVLEFKIDVYKQIERFLKIIARESEHTAVNYEGDIRRFFMKVRDKKIEQINKDDLKFSYDEMEDYYTYLIDELGLAASTANRYFTSVRQVLIYLSRKGYIDNISFLNIDMTSDNAKSHGILTFDEVEEMTEFALRQGKEETGLIKYYLIKFSVDTCARVSECLNLKWSNFIIEEDLVRINTIGKGNKEFKPTISKNFYNELLKIKTNSVYVFNIHRNTINNMMRDLRHDMKIPESRNIVFHSFRKTGVDRVYKETRDLVQAMKAANHSSTKVTELYIDTDEDYGIMGYYSSKDGVDEKLFSKVSHNDLVNAIESLDKGQQMHINLRLQKLLKE